MFGPQYNYFSPSCKLVTNSTIKVTYYTVLISMLRLDAMTMETPNVKFHLASLFDKSSKQFTVLKTFQKSAAV